MKHRPSGTSWIQVETLIEILDRMIATAESDDRTELLRKLRQDLINELNALPWDWR